jgi:DNA-binding ferritin-like protein
MEQLKKLYHYIRCMQIYYQHCHNVVAHNSFLPDHSLFGDFYDAMDIAYDNIKERCIGLHGPEYVNALEELKDCYVSLQKYPMQSKENKEFFKAALDLEQQLNQMLNILIKAEETSEGTRNLLAQLADDSEARQYKIKQRIR